MRSHDVDDYRLTAFLTNTTRGQLADLELRHRRRARCEDRIRIAKDTGLAAFPLQGFDQNRVWLLIVQLENDLLAWMAMLAFTSADARRWEPKTLRVRIFTTAATLVRTARRKIIHVKDTGPCAGLITTGWNALATLSPP